MWRLYCLQNGNLYLPVLPERRIDRYIYIALENGTLTISNRKKFRILKGKSHMMDILEVA